MFNRRFSTKIFSFFKDFFSLLKTKVFQGGRGVLFLERVVCFKTIADAQREVSKLHRSLHCIPFLYCRLTTACLLKCGRLVVWLTVQSVSCPWLLCSPLLSIGCCSFYFVQGLTLLFSLAFKRNTR